MIESKTVAIYQHIMGIIIDEETEKSMTIVKDQLFLLPTIPHTKPLIDDPMMSIVKIYISLFDIFYLPNSSYADTRLKLQK